MGWQDGTPIASPSPPSGGSTPVWMQGAPISDRDSEFADVQGGASHRQPAWSFENYAAPARGIGKGLYNTFAGATRLLAPIPAAVGLGNQFPPLRDAPVEENEQMGANVGEALPYFAPGGPVKGLAGAVVQGAKAGGIAAAQGKDPTLPAAFGAAGPIAAPLVGKAVRAILPAGTRQYAQALGPTTVENKRLTEKLVPELISRRVHGSRESLGKLAGEQIETSGAALEEALKGVPKGKAVDVAAVMDHLHKLKKQYIVPGKDQGSSNIVNQAAYDNLGELQNMVASTQPTFDSVRQLRKILDDMVVSGDRTFGRTVAEGSKLDATREAANAIRRELAKAAPNVALVNKEYSFWKNVDRVLSATKQRTASQSQGLGQQITEAVATPAAVAAVATGQLGTASGIAIPVLLRKVIQSPAWRTFSAVQKDRLAQAIASRDAQEVGRLLGMGASGGVASMEGDR